MATSSAAAQKMWTDYDFFLHDIIFNLECEIRSECYKIFQCIDVEKEDFIGVHVDLIGWHVYNELMECARK